MKTILPICMAPAIRSLGFYAFPLSIIQSNEQQFTPWLYNEFTQIYATVPMNDDFVIKFYSRQEDYNHDYQPLIAHKMILSDLIMEDVLALYRTMLQNHYYVYTFVDKWYLSAYELKDHWWHDLMLYGFDDQEKVFYAEGYVNNYIRTFLIPYNEMEAACRDGAKLAAQEQYAVFYRLRDVDIPTDLGQFRAHLYDYIQGNNTRWRESPNASKTRNSHWGMDCYELVRDYCRGYREGDRIVRLASIYPLAEHKSHMHRRLRYLAQTDQIQYSEELDSRMQTLVTKANAMINRFVRAHQKRDLGMEVEDGIQSAEGLVTNMEHLEKSCLEELIHLNRDIFNL